MKRATFRMSFAARFIELPGFFRLGDGLLCGGFLGGCGRGAVNGLKSHCKNPINNPFYLKK